MIARGILAAVFIVAGLLKLPDPAAFAEGIAGFRFLPEWSVGPLALGMPVFELLTGLALLGRRFRSAGALAATGLTLAFALLYAWALARGLDVRCSCFGGAGLLRVSNPVGLLRALAMLALAAWVYRRESLFRD